MSLFLTVGCRVRQIFLRAGRRGGPAEQQSEEGPGSVFTAAQLLRSNRLRKPLVVLSTDADPWKDRVLRALEESSIEYVLWENVPGRPTTENGDNIALAWIREMCDCFIVLGPWHVIDVVKAAAARVGARSESILALAGRKRLRRRRLPPVLAIPTTAGSGAEAVSWAGVTDRNGNPFVLEAPGMAPAFAVLDPELLENTTRPELAQSVMNGLCLAAEAYLSAYGDEASRHDAAEALRGFLENAEACWNSSGTQSQRLALLRASRLAGSAAARAGCGYARALSRAAVRVEGGEFGDVCAGVLPAVLEKYGNHAVDRLAALAELSGAAEGGSKADKAAALIARLRQIAFRMGLPDLSDRIGADSLYEIADLAAAEANPRYACPTVWSPEELAAVLKYAHEK